MTKQLPESRIGKVIESVLDSLSFNPNHLVNVLLLLPPGIQYRFMAAYLMYCDAVVQEVEGGNALITDTEVFYTAKRIQDFLGPFDRPTV